MVGKVDVEAFSVAGDGCGCRSCESMFSVIEMAFVNGGAPLLLSGFSVDAQDDLFFGIGVGGRDEDLIPDNGG